MNFYRLSAEEQRERAFRKLLRFIRHKVFPFHPHFRKSLAKEGISPFAIQNYGDFCRIPLQTKEDYRQDPRAFILQPKFPGHEERIPYDTERIDRLSLARYAVQALLNIPKDLSPRFRRVPFAEGRVGRRAAWEWMPIHFHASTGSTGAPTPAVYTLRDIRKNIFELASLIFIEPDPPPAHRPRLTWEKKNMSLFPGTPHLAFFQTILSKLLVGMSSFDTCGGRVVPAERAILAFSEGEFNSLTAIPSYLTYWFRKAAEMLKEGKVKPMPHLEGVILGGEPLNHELRQQLKEMAHALGCHPQFQVVESYGMTEMKWAFLECEEGSSIHLDPKYFFWEMLHPETLKPVPEGEPGLLVFSHIDWRGTVFVRYNTGDLIRGGMRWGKCPACGYIFPRISSPIMRAVKDFTKIKGTRVGLPDLISVVRETKGVRSFRIVIDKERPGDVASRDVLKVLASIEGGEFFDDVASRIRDRVKKALEVTPDEVLHVQEEKIEEDLFQRTGIKADYVEDRRPLTL